MNPDDNSSEPSVETSRGSLRIGSPLALVAAFSVVFGVVGLAASAWEQDWTYDESFHLKWSRRLLHDGVTERSTWAAWDSKTPISVPNVLAMDAARGAGMRGAPRRLAARAPGVLWYLGTLLVAGALARRYFGKRAGYLAVIATGLEPSLVAHSAIVTADAPYALATLLAIWSAIRYGERATAWRALALGAALGFALTAKFTAVLLVPGLLLAVVVFVPGGVFRRRPRQLLIDAVLAGIGTVAVINAAYLGAGFGEPLSSVEWRSDQFKALVYARPDLRLPLPIDFTTGIDRSLNRERKRDWQVWILDKKYPDGVWWYFVVSWLLKTPLALLAAQLAALVGLLRSRRLAGHPVVLALWLNCALAWTYFSFFFRAQIGYRYVLFSVPILAVMVAAAWKNLVRPGWLSPAAAALAFLIMIETGPYLGNELAFTNSLVQPKLLAFRYFTNSTVDYGQNDDRVVDWIADLRARGQTVHHEPSHILVGWNVFPLTNVNSQPQQRWLRSNLDPVAHFRHTQLAFDVTPSLYQRFLDEDRTLVAEPIAATRCLGPTGVEVDFQTWTDWPNAPPAPQTWFVCAETPEGVDLGVSISARQLLLGRPDRRVRFWDVVGSGQQAWYRLKPGLHVLAATRTAGVTSRWLISGGQVRLWLVPAKILPGGYIGSPRPPSRLRR